MQAAAATAAKEAEETEEADAEAVVGEPAEAADTASAVDGAPAALPTKAPWAAINSAATSRHATGDSKKRRIPQE
jgi:hypothetical protein